MLNESKCEFSKESVKFVGHIISKSGIQPSQDKLEAVRKFRTPESPEEVRSFLGYATYLCRFIPNLATKSEPLRELIKQGQKFSWKTEHEECFSSMKNLILSSQHLQFFDKRANTTIIADASPVGLGAVLLQDGKDKKMENIIMYASKSLSQAEKRYCQTEREGLAVVWAIERFHYFVFGSHFTIITDHKALTFLFKPSSKPSARIERWVLRLQGYDFDVVYKSGKENIADPFSRLSAVDKDPESFDEEADHYVCAIVETDTKAVTVEQIREENAKDGEFKAIQMGLKTGVWSNEISRWKMIQDELCLEKDLLVRGNRLFIPKIFREKILEAAHEGHPGRNKMINRLRDKVWWPNMTKNAEDKLNACFPCALVAKPDFPTPLKMRKLPDRPWKDLATDFTDATDFGKKLLVVVDYYTRYVEIKIQSSECAAETIESFQQIFPLFGYPETITCDNGPPFSSKEFKTYCDSYAIRIFHTIPEWPQANGLVERQNRGIKKNLQISKQQNPKEWKKRLLVDYLTMYRSTAQDTTGVSPFEMMFGRKMRNKIPALTVKSSFDASEVGERDKIVKGLRKEREDESRGAKESKVELGDKVLLKNTDKSKLTTNFGKEIYTVVSKNHADCVIQSEREGVERRRHVQVLKKVPEGIGMQIKFMLKGKGSNHNKFCFNFNFHYSI